MNVHFLKCCWYFIHCGVRFSFLGSWGRVYDCVVLLPGRIFPRLFLSVFGVQPVFVCLCLSSSHVDDKRGKSTDLMECEDIQQRRVCLKRLEPYKMQGSCFIQDLGMIKRSGTTIQGLWWELWRIAFHASTSYNTAIYMIIYIKPWTCQNDHRNCHSKIWVSSFCQTITFHLMATWCFGIRIGVPLSNNNPFHFWGSRISKLPAPKQQLTIAWGHGSTLGRCGPNCGTGETVGRWILILFHHLSLYFGICSFPSKLIWLPFKLTEAKTWFKGACVQIIFSCAECPMSQMPAVLSRWSLHFFS